MLKPVCFFRLLLEGSIVAVKINLKCFFTIGSHPLAALSVLLFSDDCLRSKLKAVESLASCVGSKICYRIGSVFLKASSFSGTASNHEYAIWVIASEAPRYIVTGTEIFRIYGLSKYPEFTLSDFFLTKIFAFPPT